MSNSVKLSLFGECLDSGSPEELATFGILAVSVNDRILTIGMDTESHQHRFGPRVPGYPVAEWLAWNWWRIRWELGRPTCGKDMFSWEFAHRMASIGEGYAWPNLTIFSDGLRAFLAPEPSRETMGVLFQYLGDPGTQSVSCLELEAAVDAFVEDVLYRLDGRELRRTNLHRIWSELREERDDAGAARFRKLEAKLGCDPDEFDEATIYRHLEGEIELGKEALGELAADAAMHGQEPATLTTAEDIDRMACRAGFDAKSEDSIKLEDVPQFRKAEETEA